MPNRTPLTILVTPSTDGPRPRTAAIVLGGLWLLLFFAALFSPPLLDDADATHASAARAMVATGDLVTLRVDGVRYLEKAPLPYWLTALSFRIFGFNTFATHLPQALAVLLLAALGYRWATRAFGLRTAFYTALAVLTSVGVFLFTRILIPEVLLSLLLATSLYAMLRLLAADPTARPASFYMVALWSALALAVLTKGLVALVFFFAAAIAFLTFTGEWSRWRLLRPFRGGLLLLAIAAPWHILAGLRNTGGANGHGFFWFYFINEHVLRFLGRREPMDYNKLPSYLYWSLHLVWLFPWALFLPLGIGALDRRLLHQTEVLTAHIDRRWHRDIGFACLFGVAAAVMANNSMNIFAAGFAACLGVELLLRRRSAGLVASPFHRIDAQQRSILLLASFASIVLIFFALSTNQEYYTFPAYLPILMLIAATIARAEQGYDHDTGKRRWIACAHAAFTAIGAAAAIALAYGLWASRRLPYVPDIGDLLAHRGVGDYTLSMSHFFDLTGESFAALRLPAALAMIALAVGPGIAWLLRSQRRHLAATTAIALTSASFLIAAHIALGRFAPMLSSEDMAAKIIELEDDGAIQHDRQVMLYGDQAYGSSIPFYLGEQVKLVNGRSTSMLFGSSFPDAPKVFLTGEELAQQWGAGPRKILFVPLEKRGEVDRLLGTRQVVIDETSGKALITDRPLDKH
ncbi:4-amino-4-deoxy-L-arabinose transferase [Granulicella rosea]|uniref:4-amino-4-deoxy-L-arabinose transferase n=1 Tax=Granulicella rosea TaxID=474952 RepID=A0A239L361_9BACT|nr:glycosyltransferase family 39 protein [Granulicella rosea]SNT24432.1 4-amino-4-deoxy-L-arabinose transferase [Granulicella rosea]